MKRGGLRSVLLVEDDGDLRNAVAELIEDEGYQCFHAKDGIDALAALNRQRPALLIADLIMPRMNGVSLLARLRADPSRRDIPVIAMTAANDRMVGVRLDAPILHKPIEVPVLRKMLARYCPLDNPKDAATENGEAPAASRIHVTLESRVASRRSAT